jgi:7-cyano-7-deazaguanine synthase
MSAAKNPEFATPAGKALVILSGGQDSATCLFWALRKFSAVETITFDYGQRHRIELECAAELCRQQGLKNTLIPIDSLKALGANALVDCSQKVSQTGGFQNLPSTFVPGRNALFLTLAAAYAAPRGISNLVIGACETDFSGYPDCRDVFMESMEKSLSLAMDYAFKIHRPLMRINKAQTFQMADDLGALQSIVDLTHTCYEGVRAEKHEWGYGCGECPACQLRQRGFQEYRKIKESAHG